MTIEKLKAEAKSNYAYLQGRITELQTLALVYKAAQEEKKVSSWADLQKKLKEKQPPAATIKTYKQLQDRLAAEPDPNSLKGIIEGIKFNTRNRH